MLSPKLPGPLLRHYGAQALSPVAERFYGRRWTPATSSNLSLRVDEDRALVTASGGHKRFLTGDALVLMGLDGTVLDGAEGAQPSAEAALHLALYARDSGLGAVLHAHAPSTVIWTERYPKAAAVELTGAELLKAFPEVHTHESHQAIPVVPNSQDMTEVDLAVVAAQQGLTRAPPAYLIRGHGAYVWGASLFDAERHMEALVSLLEHALSLPTPEASP